MKKSKLVLRSDTIRNLDTTQLRNVAGAQAASPAFCQTMRDTCGVSCIPTGSVW